MSLDSFTVCEIKTQITKPAVLFFYGLRTDTMSEEMKKMSEEKKKKNITHFLTPGSLGRKIEHG